MTTATLPPPIRTLVRVGDSAAALESARAQLVGAVLTTHPHLDADVQSAVVRFLCWEVPSLRAAFLADAVGSSTRDLRRLAGPGPARGTCTGWRTTIHVASCSELGSRPPERCQDCRHLAWYRPPLELEEDDAARELEDDRGPRPVVG